MSVTTIMWQLRPSFDRYDHLLLVVTISRQILTLTVTTILPIIFQSQIWIITVYLLLKTSSLNSPTLYPPSTPERDLSTAYLWLYRRLFSTTVLAEWSVSKFTLYIYIYIYIYITTRIHPCRHHAFRNIRNYDFASLRDWGALIIMTCENWIAVSLCILSKETRNDYIKHIY